MTTVIVDGNDGGSDANAEAVEELADAVEELVEQQSESMPTDVALDHERRITQLEDAMQISAAAIAEVADDADNAQVVAEVAFASASDAQAQLESVDELVEEAIEDSELIDTDNDGKPDDIEAPDVAPIGSKSHWLDRPASEWKDRLLS